MKKSSVTPAPQSPVQQQSLDISAQQRAAQTGQVQQAAQTAEQAKAPVQSALDTVGTTQTALNPYLPGSTGMSDFRKGLYGTLSSATNRAGENAIASSRARAQAAGFGGGSQPIQYGAESQIGNETASRLGQIPAQVEQQAAPIELQAAQQYGQTAQPQIQASGETNAIAGTEGNLAKVYNPESYYSTGANLAGQNQQDLYNQLQQQRQQKSGIWGTLAKTALGVGTSLIPGLGAAKQTFSY